MKDGDAVTRLGELLRLYRAAHDLTTRQLGDEMQLHYSAISRMEHRTMSMSAHTLVKVMAWLLAPKKKKNGEKR